MMVPYFYTKTYVWRFLKRICLVFKTPPFTGFIKRRKRHTHYFKTSLTSPKCNSFDVIETSLPRFCARRLRNVFTTMNGSLGYCSYWVERNALMTSRGTGFPPAYIGRPLANLGRFFSWYSLFMKATLFVQVFRREVIYDTVRCVLQFLAGFRHDVTAGGAAVETGYHLPWSPFLGGAYPMRIFYDGSGNVE